MRGEISWKDTPMSTNFEAPDNFIDQLIDIDPAETAEWQESFDAVLKLSLIHI